MNSHRIGSSAAKTMMRRNQNQWRKGGHTSIYNRTWRRMLGNYRNLIILLVVMALAPPIFFHFRLRRIHQMRMKECGWLIDPPLVCAHGGDSTNSFPNTIAAYRSALYSRVDCIEIDVSRSSDGVLFALHDRDLHRISGNYTSRVGFLSAKEINELHATPKFPGILDDRKVPTIEDALTLVSDSVRQVVLDAKTGPPSYEKGLAENILAVVKRTDCANCIVWAKSDTLVRDIIRLSQNTSVGYVVMRDPSTGARSNLLRIKRAGVVGIYHPLIDEKVVQILHGRNKKIYAWTVDDVVSMQDMLSKRVDAVVTSKPTVLQQLMQDTRVQCLEDGFSLP